MAQEAGQPASKACRIRFLNHSCIVLESPATRILCDPWFEGTAFNDGWRLLAIFLATVTGLVLQPISGGALDTSFSTDGQLFTTMGNGNSFIRTIALQSDGKIIVAGYCLGLSTIDFCIARYHGTGALDTSFNTDGRAISTIGSGDDTAYSVAIQSDGKVVVVGNCSNGSNDDFCVA